MKTNKSKLAVCGMRALAIAGAVFWVGAAVAPAQDTEKHETSVAEFESKLGGETPAQAPRPGSKLPGGRNRQANVDKKPEVTLHIEFKYNSTEIADDFSKGELKRLGEAMNGAKLSPYPFEIVGHTDLRGSAAYNQKLSEDRANAIVAVLTKEYHVAPSRLRAIGRGLNEPLTTGTTEADHQKNRRVVITRVD